MEENKSTHESKDGTEHKSDQKYGLISYNAVFERAYLEHHQRALLSLYTLKYNWVNDGEVFTSLPTLARLLGRKDPETIGKWLQELVALGWVEDDLRYREGSEHKLHHVRPVIGRDNEVVATQARDMLLKQKDLTDEERQFISTHCRRQDEHEKYMTAIENYKPRRLEKSFGKNYRKPK